MRAVRQFVLNHPLWAAFLSFLVIGLPQWLSGVWSLFSGDPLAPIVVANLRAMSVPTFQVEWITIPLGLSMFIYVVYEVRRGYGRQWNAGREKESGAFIAPDALSDESETTQALYRELEQRPEGLVLPAHPTDSTSWKHAIFHWSGSEHERMKSARRLVQLRVANVNKTAGGSYLLIRVDRECVADRAPDSDGTLAAGYNKVAHGIPYERELRAMTYAQLAINLDASPEGSPRYRVLEREIRRRNDPDDGRDESPAPHEFVSAPDAVVRVNDSFHATANDKYLLQWMEGEPDEKSRLGLAVRVLANDAPLYGARPHKTIREPIDLNGLDYVMGELTDNATILCNRKKQVIYSDIAFKGEDIDAFIERTLRGE